MTKCLKIVFSLRNTKPAKFLADLSGQLVVVTLSLRRAVRRVWLYRIQYVP